MIYSARTKHPPPVGGTLFAKEGRTLDERVSFSLFAVVDRPHFQRNAVRFSTHPIFKNPRKTHD